MFNLINGMHRHVVKFKRKYIEVFVKYDINLCEILRDFLNERHLYIKSYSELFFIGFELILIKY